MLLCVRMWSFFFSSNFSLLSSSVPVFCSFFQNISSFRKKDTKKERNSSSLFSLSLKSLSLSFSLSRRFFLTRERKKFAPFFLVFASRKYVHREREKEIDDWLTSEAPQHFHHHHHHHHFRTRCIYKLRGIGGEWWWTTKELAARTTTTPPPPVV